MWKFYPGHKCKKCGADWLPFYFYRWKNGKVYGGGVCRLCWREERNEYNRVWEKKRSERRKLKNRIWEQRNRAYRLKYRKKLRLKQTWNSHWRKYE